MALSCDISHVLSGLVDLNISQEMGFLQQVVQNIFCSFMIMALPLFDFIAAEHYLLANYLRFEMNDYTCALQLQSRTQNILSLFSMPNVERLYE